MERMDENERKFIGHAPQPPLPGPRYTHDMRFTTVIAVALVLCGSVARAQESGSQRKGLSESLERAWSRGDTKAMAVSLDAAWEADAEWARKRTLQILASNQELFRPSALAALAEHAEAKVLIDAIRTADKQRAVGERRWLTYALGSRAKEETGEALVALLKDQDVLVRAAAATALAGYEDPRVLDSVLPLMREHPAWKPAASEDDQHVLQMALYGGFELLTGERPGTPQEAKRLLADALADSPRGKKEPREENERVRLNVRGKEYLKLDRFNLLYDLGPRAEISEARLRQLEKEVLPATDRMVKAGRSYFGPIVPAAVRFIIADKQRFSSYAGNSFRPGVSQGNQIVLREMDPETMRTVVAHEYIHVLQQAAFPKQPRWLVEGMAESLSLSTDGTVWTSAQLRVAGIDKEIEKGVFGPLMNWDGSASSGDQESRLYKMAHVAIDSLRFGGYGDPDVRLFLLMSRIGEGENPPAVFRSIYGEDARGMDAKLRAWLAR